MASRRYLVLGTMTLGIFDNLAKEVTGMSFNDPPKNWAFSLVGKASRWQREERGFKSHKVHQ